MSSPDPFLEADLGLKRRLLLSSKQLEWRPRTGEAVIAKVAEIEQVRLLSRPAWESLSVGAVALLASLLLSQWTWRALFGGIASLALASCFLQRRYALLVLMADGSTRRLELGVGSRRSPLVQRIDSVWESLRPALEELGVKS